jgi:hypothetical protein
MHQPQYFDDGSGHVFHLVQSLYGLYQVAQCWNKFLHHKLTTIEYQQTYLDANVYV